MIDCRPSFGRMPRNRTIAIAQYSVGKVRCPIKKLDRRCERPMFSVTFKGKAVPRASRYVEKTGILEIRGFDQDDVGVYNCTYESRYGSDVKLIRLTMKDGFIPTKNIIDDVIPKNETVMQPDRPYWTWQMTEKSETIAASEGERVKMSCFYYRPKNSKKNGKVKARWFYRPPNQAQSSHRGLYLTYKKFTPRQKERGYKLLRRRVDCVTNLTGECLETTLVIKRPSKEDAGFYTCVVLDKNYTMRWNYYLRMDVSPFLSHQPRSQKTSGAGERDQGRNPYTANLNPNSTKCVGDSLLLKCTGSPRDEVNMVLLRLGTGFDLFTNNFGNNSVTLATRSPGGGIESIPDVHRLPEHGTDSLFKTTLIYMLKSLTEADSGHYLCGAGFGSTYAYALMTLDVQQCSLKSYTQSTNAVIGSIIAVSISILLSIILLIVGCVWERHRRRSSAALRHSVRKRVVVISRPNKIYVSSKEPLLDPTPSVLDTKRPRLSSSASSAGPDSVFSDSSSAPLVPPQVLIENRFVTRLKGRSSNTTTTDSGEGDSEFGSADRILYEFPLDPAWEVPRQNLTQCEVLGSGAFGVVRRGEVRDLPNRPGLTVVAVKMLKTLFDEQDVTDLVKEMEVMKLMEPHPHLIRLHGTCTQGGPLLVLTEFATFGNLRDFLRMRRPEAVKPPGLVRPNLSTRDFLTFGYQVAKGMEYLATKSIIHRDLAARNILVGDGFCMKIADFGMTRSIEQYYKKTSAGRLPVKWLAPESLFDKKYTTKSDVWAFGILLWEIFTFGGTPYPSVPVERLYLLLRRGHRNERPELADRNVYSIMTRCWHDEAVRRPSFGELVLELDRLLSFLNEDEEYLCMRGEDSGVTIALLPTSSTSGQGDSALGTRSSVTRSEGHSPTDFSGDAFSDYPDFT